MSRQIVGTIQVLIPNERQSTYLLLRTWLQLCSKSPSFCLGKYKSVLFYTELRYVLTFAEYTYDNHERRIFAWRRRADDHGTLPPIESRHAPIVNVLLRTNMGFVIS